jgi:hypothetical protein
VHCELKKKMDINEKNDRSKDEVFVRQYLLGVLPDTESDRLVQRSLDDEAFFEEIQEIEDELIDDYASGALTDQDRIRFEEYFLCSPARREKLRIALAMTERAVRWKEQRQINGSPLNVEAHAPLTASSEEDHDLGNVLPFSRSSQTVPAWRLWGAIAAAVLIAVGTGALWLRNSELRREVLRANAEEIRLRNEADVASARAEQIAEEKKQAQEQATSFHDQMQALTDRLEKLQPKTILSAFVGLENILRVTRGKNIGRTKTIKVPPNALALRLSIEFDATRFQNFEATLERGKGHRVWSSSKALKPRTSGDIQGLMLKIPAQSLGAGAYQLIIRAAESEGKDEVARYLLNIKR